MKTKENNSWVNELMQKLKSEIKSNKQVV